MNLMGLKEAIGEVRASIVQIRTMAGVLGTGFFVAESGHIATAQHVVDAAGVDQILVGFAHDNTENMRANFTLVDAAAVAGDAARDVALILPSRNPFADPIGTGFVINDVELPLPHRVATLDPARPADGEAIAISGYPLSNPVLITTSGAVASAWPYDVEEVTPPGAPPGWTMPSTLDLYVADVQGNPGNSGGPAYRISDSAVIGVCIQVQMAPTRNASGEVGEFAADAGLTVLRPARYVLDLMATAGI